MVNTMEEELDLMELLRYLKKKLLPIGCVAVVCAVVGCLLSMFLIAPKYTASTRMYVLNRTHETNVVFADIQTSTYLSSDYMVLIKGQNVTAEVVERLGLDMTSEQLENMIQVTAPEDTRVLQINVTDVDPQRAADIANCVREVAGSQIQEIMDVDAVKLVYEAVVPQEPSSPNVLANTVLAAMLGVVGMLCVLVVIFVLDDTIRTEEDVERYLGLNTLGVIPVATELDNQQKNGRFGKTAK